jgi:hypothetical protein
MGPLATEPPKPRPTKHTYRHNPLRSVNWLYRPTASHPRGIPAISSQRPHLNHERHRTTRIYQPHPQTYNPARQIHSIATWTCTEACWNGIWPDGLCGFLPKAAGMRPEACGPHGPPPAPMPRSRSSPGSDARHRSPDVTLGFAEYARFPIYICLSFSLFAL